jgi:glycosyltransferase involved in cell wall biosynthesis
MKILLFARNFLPNIGGVESATDSIARALVRRGHEVTVVTRTASTLVDRLPYSLIRRPSAIRLSTIVRDCDICFHNNISLRAAWPLLFAPRPWVIVHHIYLRQGSGGLKPADRVKRMVLRWARSIAVSTAVARDLPVAAEVIPSAYRDDVFRLTNHGERSCDLVFLGRLIPEKGASLLISALGRLRQRGLRPRLRVIGSGPEEPRLRREVELHGLQSQIDFVGSCEGEKLVALLNDCRILVVPSLWAEPFGIVALEAIACGCAVVGSADGGLPDAIGPCGATFPNGDGTALADRLAELLGDPARLSALRAPAAAHLGLHTADAIAEAWLRFAAGSSPRAGNRALSAPAARPGHTARQAPPPKSKGVVADI